MKKMVVSLMAMSVALAVLALAAQPANAQKKGGGGGFGGGNPVGLLSNKDVQKDLKLSDTQVTKIDEFSTKYAEASKGVGGFGKKPDKEAAAKLEEVRKSIRSDIEALLSKDQAKRLQQLNNQRRGPGLFGDEAAVKELGIGDDLKSKIDEINKAAQAKRLESFKGLGKDATKEDREAATKKSADISKAAIADIVKLLSADQKSKYEAMVGAPFAGTFPPAFGGFGGGIFPKKGDPKKVDPKKILED